MPDKLALATCLVLSAASAWASLGEDRLRLDEVHQGQSQMSTSSGVQFTQLRLELKTGTVVRACRDRSGFIFAISWAGPFMPDMRELLGVHFTALSAQQRRPGPGGSLVVRNERVVVISEGRLGAFRGRAWLPGQLPAGFEPEDLQ